MQSDDALESSISAYQRIRTPAYVARSVVRSKQKLTGANRLTVRVANTVIWRLISEALWHCYLRKWPSREGTTHAKSYSPGLCFVWGQFRRKDVTCTPVMLAWENRKHQGGGGGGCYTCWCETGCNNVSGQPLSDRSCGLCEEKAYT